MDQRFEEGKNGLPPLVRLSETGRLEAFSEGVFSVTITLLLYEVARPEYRAGRLLDELLGQWSTYVAFLASFLYVAVIWLNHRAVFARVRFSDLNLHWANLILLLASALIPFPTAILSTALLSGDAYDARIAVALYALVGAVMCLSWLYLFHVLHIHHHLLERGVEPAFFARERGRAFAAVVLYAAAGVLGWVSSPMLALAIFLALPVFYGVTSEGLTEGPLLRARIHKMHQGAVMADARECRRQAAECARLSSIASVPRTKTVLSSMSKSWGALANQIDRLGDVDPDQTAHLARAR